jgi:hypothetical protein
LTETAGTDDGIINAASDWSLTDEKTIGDSGQMIERVLVFVGDWFARAIRWSLPEHRARPRRKADTAKAYKGA